MKRGLVNSVRKDYFNDDPDRDKETFAEMQMKSKGNRIRLRYMLTFKDKLREVIQIELADPNNRTLEDVVNALVLIGKSIVLFSQNAGCLFVQTNDFYFNLDIFHYLLYVSVQQNAIFPLYIEEAFLK